jgi:hypothetical protein
MKDKEFQNVQVKESTHRKLKVLAAKEGRVIKHLTDELLLDALKRRALGRRQAIA